jgi:hypothetical protein
MNALREQPARGEAPWVPTGKEMDGEKACAAAAAATQSANCSICARIITC